MKVIPINNFKERVYYEKLDNGLDVYLVPLSNKRNYYFSYGVKFGSRNTMFKINDKLYTVPTGIAHFLEHKLFEKEIDPFVFYQKYGVDVNASTSYDFTNYYIIGNKKVKTSFAYLLDWLKELNINDYLVEKEKGIILEEASMHKDNHSRVLSEKLRSNVFVKDPYRNKVIGSDSDIKRITKEDLELCFNNFYTPKNMFVVGVGDFKVKDILELIKEKNNENKKMSNATEYFEKEPDEINKEYEEVKMNIDVPKIGVAYKFNKSIFSQLNISDFELDVYIHTLIDIGLGVASDIREEWLKKGLFINATYRVIDSETHYVFEFSAFSNKCDDLLKSLKDYLKDIKISKDAFEREKKLWIAREIKASGDIRSIAYNIMDDILDYGEFIPNKIELLKKLNYEVLEELKNILVFDKCAVVKIVSK